MIDAFTPEFIHARRRRWRLSPRFEKSLDVVCCGGRSISNCRVCICIRSLLVSALILPDLPLGLGTLNGSRQSPLVRSHTLRQLMLPLQSPRLSAFS